MPKVLAKTRNAAVLFAGTLAYLVAIAGVILVGLIWEGCNRISAAIRGLKSDRLP